MLAAWRRVVFRATTGLVEVAITELQTEYVGTRGQLFRLALVTSVLTVLTLGLYRFWMKTRLRRYYWSAIRPGGQALEYVGEPLEKLLGFLIAVVILAFYIGIVNLILIFASFALLNDSFWAYGVSIIGVIPIIFYARYRARRYILARTRWRGVRFGMEQGAWGYTWRAMLHWLVTIISGGLLWPRMTFWLEKYRADRTYFGLERFTQGGRWPMLYRPFLPLLSGLIIALAGGIVATESGPLGGVPIVASGALMAVYGLAHYKAHSFRLLSNTKRLGAIGFRSAPRPWRVLRIYLLGYALVAIGMIALMLVLGVAIVVLLWVFDLNLTETFDFAEVGASIPFWVSSIFTLLGYFAVFIFWGVLGHVLVTLPLARHFAETLQITGAANLSAIRQRDRDELAQAEGFAEALDVGAAI
ncbi:MAG: DUF898 family protein [Paracoccaceae bacterium]